MSKICKSCGVEKPLTEYYRTPAGTPYGYCKECWSIDMRRRNLLKKATLGPLTASDAARLAQIDQLYEMRRAAGLQNPGESSKAAPLNVFDAVSKQLATFGQQS